MDPFLKMDIFFIAATIALVIVTVLAAVVLIYLARFLATLDRIANNALEEAEAIREDLDDMRERMKKSRLWFVPLFSFFGKTAKRFSAPKKKGKKT
ncbi:MAG: hypothetical protein V4480_03560 [Patescibacteria group bacterium]